MSALMKYWNDPKTLAKIGERMGPVAADTAAAPQPQAAAAASMPEINNLLDAAKWVFQPGTSAGTESSTWLWQVQESECIVVHQNCVMLQAWRS